MPPGHPRPTVPTYSTVPYPVPTSADPKLNKEHALSRHWSVYVSLLAFVASRVQSASWSQQATQRYRKYYVGSQPSAGIIGCGICHCNDNYLLQPIGAKSGLPFHRCDGTAVTCPLISPHKSKPMHAQPLGPSEPCVRDWDHPCTNARA